MINYWPTEEMEEYLRLQTRVEARMALADAAASGDENPLDNYEGIQGELNFRAQQLKQLLDEDLDLDDLTDDGVTMSDFTLDQFFTQLLRYLEENREELEQTALGAYAVVDSEKDTGVIWVLRQRNASQDRQTQVASPVHPFYIVHVRNDGKIRRGCASVRQTLDLFHELSLRARPGRSTNCATFNRSTANGPICRLRLSAQRRHRAHQPSARQEPRSQGSVCRDRETSSCPKPAETPSRAEDFELVTWLAVLPKKEN